MGVGAVSTKAKAGEGVASGTLAATIETPGRPRQRWQTVARSHGRTRRVFLACSASGEGRAATFAHQCSFTFRPLASLIGWFARIIAFSMCDCGVGFEINAGFSFDSFLCGDAGFDVAFCCECWWT